MTERGRLVFAPSRYGPEVAGGAEAVQRELAIGLAKRGWDVEIATTCAIDHFTWENTLPEGLTEIDGIPVRRFRAEQPLPERGVHERDINLGFRPTITNQYRWLNAGMRSPDLYHYLLDNQHRFRGMVFAPYPTWLAVAGSQIAASRSVLWACLHDEPYVRLDVFRPMLTGVAGLFLMTDPEHDLLHRIVRDPAPHEVVGCTVPMATAYDPEGFRERHSIERPFVLFAGRREGAKGWDELLRAFEAAVLRLDLPFDLVTIGAGEVIPPASIADRVIDLGFLPESERDNAFAAASACVQPSRLEAFSRTVMEAWLAGTPVVANAGSEVVSWHCRRSRAGLTYQDSFELEECLSFIADRPAEAAAMGDVGRAYVLEHYDSDVVIDRVDELLDRWLKEPWKDR